MLIKALLILALLGTAQAQQPNCSEAELRASMANASAAAERTKAETCGARNDSLERELGKQKSQLSETEARLSANISTLAEFNESAKRRIAELERALAITTSERDVALLKIKRANGKWLCEIFRLGCVKVN